MPSSVHKDLPIYRRIKEDNPGYDMSRVNEGESMTYRTEGISGDEPLQLILLDIYVLSYSWKGNGHGCCIGNLGRKRSRKIKEVVM